ncbi:MAG TPA: hypothetical protein PKD12_16265 [Nitrospira sp.]|nr:hypothetical protein [Nitrospira sp.]
MLNRLVFFANMEGVDAERAYRGCIKKLRHVTAALRQTLTDDRGTAMAAPEQLAKHLAIRVFSVTPHCPWQRGPNENTNRLLR